MTRGLHASLTLALLLFSSSGCIAFPTRFEFRRDHGSHAPVDHRLYDKLVEGATTRTEIRQLVGRRDVELADGRLWVYSWEDRTVFGWAFFGMSTVSAGGGEFLEDGSAMHYLLLEFDQQHVLAKKKIHHGGRINGLANCLADAMMK